MPYHKVKHKPRKQTFKEYVKKQKIPLIKKSDFKHIKNVYKNEKGKFGKPFKQNGKWYVYFNWKFQYW